MNYDITFCVRDCENKECKRNLKYVKINNKPFISMANFNNCKDFKESEDTTRDKL